MPVLEQEMRELRLENTAARRCLAPAACATSLEFNGRRGSDGGKAKAKKAAKKRTEGKAHKASESLTLQAFSESLTLHALL